MDICPIIYDKKTPPVQIKAEFIGHQNQHATQISIFTDGSKSAEGVGFAIVSDILTLKKKLPLCISVFTAELYAILTALKQIVLLDEKNFVIFSDSQSALKALNVFNSFNPLINEILEWLILIKRKRKNVKFCWVPAHVGVSGNESADELAKFAHIKPSAIQSWQFLWEIEGENKMREVAITLFPWKYFAMSRRKETALCRLRIGHTRYTHGFFNE